MPATILIQDNTPIPVFVSGGADAGPPGATGPAGDVARSATRAALAAIAGAVSGAARYLSEAGREGLFQFSTEAGDATLATADTLGGVYVAGTGGTWVRKFNGPADVKWFGAVGDGVADDRVAIQAAIDSGRPVLLPAATAGTIYKVSGQLNLPDQCSFMGMGMWPTVIQSTDLDAPILNLNGADNCHVGSLNLQYSGTPIAGADAVLVTSSQTCSFTDLWVSSAWNGISMVGGGNHSIHNFRCYEYEQCALLLSSVIGANLSHFRFHAGDSIRGRFGGIRLQGPVEAFSASQGDITLGKYGMTTADFGSSARGSAPYFNRFSHVFFDAPKENAALLRSLAHSDFDDCWFSSAGHDEAVGFGSAGDFAGIDMDNCTHVSFKGGDAYNNGGMAALLYTGNRYIHFGGGMRFKRNGFSRPSSIPAIEAIANTLDIDVSDCVFEKDADTTNFKQDIAVKISGTSDNIRIEGNRLGGCAIIDSSSGTNNRIVGNIGAKTRNRGYGQIDAAASTSVVAHGLAFTPAQQDVLITPLANLGAAGVSNIWVSAADATNITVSSNVAAGSTVPFTWDVRVKGA